MRAYHAELQKAKRRHDVLVCLLVPLLVLLWVSRAAPKSAERLAAGYSALLYSMPIMNAVVMPVAMALLASRLWDVETKGAAPKLLYTLQSRGSLFAAKAAFGVCEVLFIAVLEALLVPLWGCVQGYTEALPAGQLAYFFTCTLSVDTMLFFSELLLTIWRQSPMPALCVGIVGALVGLFTSFLPEQYSYFVPWGYFIPLMGYAMQWDKATRIATYTARPANVPLLAWVLCLAAALFYGAWRMVRDKEV